MRSPRRCGWPRSKNAAALLVVHKGRVVLERHWHGHRPGDRTNSASMAKTVTALLIGIAVGEGKIASIDEPAAKWIPAWRDDARSRITLRHLLQMHAGLKPMGEYEEPYSDASYLALGTDSRYVVDNVPAVDEPGRRFDYNNVNFQVLGVVLEAATGRRYAEYLSEKLWKPIGAGDAAVWLDREGGSARTFGYLFARPEDWARLGLLLLHEGECDGRAVVPTGLHPRDAQALADRADLRPGHLARQRRAPAPPGGGPVRGARHLLPRRPVQAAGLRRPVP